MITLATAAYAHHSEVKAYRLTSMTMSSMARFAAPKITIILIFEKNSEPDVAITYNKATAVLFVAWLMYTIMLPLTYSCNGYAVSAHKIYSVVSPPSTRNGSMRRRLCAVGSNRSTLRGRRKGR